ncbi:MAG: hypothetical protein ACYCWW_06260 [Deltaproteobacteria bacterium]
MLAIVLMSLQASFFAEGTPPAGPDVQSGTVRIAQAIIAKDIDKLVALTPAPFSFDGSLAKTPLEVREKWAAVLDRHPVEALHLYGVEILPYAAAVAKYGKPPARLSGLSWAGTSIAVANLGGRATIVVWKRHGSGWAPIAISD